jgi:hypothetical protein
MTCTRESARKPSAKKPSKHEVSQKFIRRLRQSDLPLNPNDVAWILQHVADKMEKGSLTFPMELMSRVQTDEVQIPKMVIVSPVLHLTIFENSKLNELEVLQHAIDGRLEILGLHNEELGGLCVYCDENGRRKYTSSPASAMMRQKLSSLFGHDAPSVVGPILFTNTDAEGDTVGLTSEQLKKIHEHFQ